MATFVVTFPVGGPLRGCYTTVDADDEVSARYLVLDEYGRDGFGAVYPFSQGSVIAERFDLERIPFGPLRAVLNP